eukprot:scaffold26031_cov21-Tisochrysis_lutea.AAC.3
MTDCLPAPAHEPHETAGLLGCTQSWLAWKPYVLRWARTSEERLQRYTPPTATSEPAMRADMCRSTANACKYTVPTKA